MESFVREKRKLIFEKKIITPSVIREFAGIIRSENKSLKDASDKPLIVFSVDANDNSSYESQSTEIFREGDILDKKTIVRVGMRFSTRDYSKNIEIQLLHILDIDPGTSGTENYILVSGDDPTWVNGILARYNELISITENQSDYKKLVEGVVVVILIILNIVYFRLFYSKIEIIENGWLNVSLTLGLPILCLVYYNKLSEYVRSLWPDVELQTGPKYLQMPILKRQKLTWISVTILIPIVMGIIYDIIKSNFL